MLMDWLGSWLPDVLGKRLVVCCWAGLLKMLPVFPNGPVDCCVCCWPPVLPNILPPC